VISEHALDTLSARLYIHAFGGNEVKVLVKVEPHLVSSAVGIRQIQYNTMCDL